MRTQLSSVKKSSSNQKICPLCKASGRPSTHFLSKCVFLPHSDKKYFAKARQIMETGDPNDEDNEIHISPKISVGRVEDTRTPISQKTSVGRVQIRQSPYLDAFLTHHPTRIVVDISATGNMIRTDVAHKLQATITPSTQYAHQADGSSPLHVSGETRLKFHHDGHDLIFEGLVDNLDTPILAGIPFMEINVITIRPA
jgi:hypothetical protein